MLSFGQRRLWALQQLAPESTAYHVVLALQIAHPVELATLRQVIDRLTQRHQLLATRFTAGADGEPAAHHLPGFLVPITWLAVPDDADWRSMARVHVDVPFDLAVAPPVRVVAIRRPSSLVVLLVMHHIVTDGWSQGVLERDLRALYHAERAGVSANLPDIAMTYAEHVTALSAAVSGGRLDGLVNYWRTELAGFEVLDLPLDHPRKQRLDDSAATFSFVLTADTTARLQALASARGCLLSSALLAAFIDVLCMYGGTRDVTIGVVLTGRDRRGLRDVVGFFANTVPLRVVIPPDATFGALAAQTQARLMAARQYQHAPLEQVVSQVAAKRDPDRNPLFDVLAVHHADYIPLPEIADFLPVEWEDRVSGFDLTLDTSVSDCVVTGVLTYRTALFDSGSIARLGGILARRIGQLVRDPDRPLRDRPRLDGDASEISSPNRASSPAVAQFVPEAFAATALACPHQAALIESGVSYTYECLDAWTDHVAVLLAGRGIGREDVVAVAMPRSAAQLAATLAIWKAGAAVLLVDLETPAERCQAMLADAAVAIVMTSADDHPFAWPVLTCPPLRPAPVPRAVPTSPGRKLTSRDAAYVLFTSGSTGRPKGVVVEHGALANLYADHVAELYGPHAGRLGRPHRAALTSSVAFGAVWNALLAMVAGHELHLISDDVRRDPPALVRYVKEHGVDYLDLTPSYAAELAANRLISDPGLAPSLLVIAGEALGAGLADELARATSVRGYNYYGPAEYTVDATRWRIAADSPIYIGRPVWNTRAYILDTDSRLVPVGVPGELYLAGPQLARGYVCQPGLTARRFVPDPFGAPGTRMYRTGDRVRLSPSGDIEYLARLDSQVKIDGYRIELQEIEAVIGRDRNVQHVAVTVQPGPGGRQRLVAHVAERDGAVDTARLRQLARDHLPAYMVPSVFVPMARLPLTSNGKVDLRRLPMPDHDASPRRTGPRDERESVLCALFAEVLGRPEAEASRIGIDDDFFELGGDSLLAARLTNRVRSVLGAPLSIRDVFETPTVAALGAKLGDDADERPPLVARRRPETVPLSAAQRRLWFLSKLDAYRAAYNVPMAVHLAGPVEEAALQSALADVVARHEILRTIYPDTDGVPEQVAVDNTARTPVLRRLEAAAGDLDALLNAEAAYQFDLEHEIPIRAALVRVADAHVLSIVVHHIAIDGWSAQPFWRDLGEAYSARLAGSPPRWAPQPIQYADFALWQQSTPADVIADQLRYWRDALDGLPGTCALPADRLPVDGETAGAGGVHARLPAGVHAQLLGIGHASSATLFMMCTVGVAAMLARMGAGDEVPIGTVVAGRADPALDNLIGCFMNTVVLRVQVSGEESFSELLDRVKGVSLGAFDHQDVPFEQVVEALRPARLGTANPLFQVAITCERAAPAGPVLTALRAAELPCGTSEAKFDLCFDFTERMSSDGAPCGVDCDLQYRADLFTEGMASRLLDCVMRIFAQAAASPDIAIGALDILTPQERSGYQRSPASAVNRRDGIPAAATLAELFYAQARRRPAAAAIRWPAGQLSYADLNARSNRLAHYLADRGAGPGERVAIALPRGPGYVTAVLAVTKTGAAFVPIDMAYPAERTSYLLADAKPTFSVTSDTQCAGYPDTDLAPLARPGDCAYVVYTSGSTGRPKGVMVSNRAIVNLLGWSLRARLMGQEDVMLAHASVGFDVSIFEVWTALAAGATVVPAPDDLSIDLPGLARHMTDCGVTHASFVPTQLAEALPLLEGSPLRLFSGGEALDADLARRIGEVWNFYGPTETTIQVTAWSGSGRDITGRTAPIGAAIDNVRAYVLDTSLRPVPTGVRGELYIAGAQLAIGYLGRPGLTAERFVADPYGDPGDRMYRTGDAVRRLPSGDLEFLGRTDDQVKIRGYRIEPGEVEAEIMRSDLVAQAAVMARDDQRGDKRLVAYVVPAGPEFDVRVLRTRLGSRLPAYLLPADVMVLDRLPLTSSGKLDKAALPSPQRGPSGYRHGPRTPSEEIVCDLFAEVLQIDEVGIDDDFFELGGHSLLAVRIASGIAARLGVPIPVHTIFRASSVAALCAVLETGTGGSSFDVVLPIRKNGDRAPLFCVHPVTGLCWCYSGLTKHVPPPVPLIGLQAPGLADGAALPRSMAELAAGCAARMKLIQAEGPYRLLGWSFGGNLAHAIAVALQRDGAAVSLLALLDSSPGVHDPDVREDDVQVAEVIGAHLAYGALANVAGDHLGRIRAVAENNARLLAAHVPGVFSGDAVLVRATGADAQAASDLKLWSSIVAGGLVSHDVAADHFDLMRPGPLGLVAGHIASWL